MVTSLHASSQPLTGGRNKRSARKDREIGHISEGLLCLAECPPGADHPPRVAGSYGTFGKMVEQSLVITAIIAIRTCN